MTREEALKQLSANSTHERLKAARFLVRKSKSEDISTLQMALQRESVSYVRTSLELALSRVANTTLNTDKIDIDEFEIPPDLRAQLKNKLTEEIAGQILHEIGSPVGLIAASAEIEIPNYDCSKTKVHVTNLQRVFEAIEQLKVASAVPNRREFDLSRLIDEIATTEVDNQLVGVSLHGANPLVITSDQALLGFALSNGIRNAVEAVIARCSDQPHPIIVTWGETDIDYWVAVIDRGVGIFGSVESAFEIGKTTKRGHSGFGLTIARQAIETLDGSCSLQPTAEGGAVFEFRWEK